MDIGRPQQRGGWGGPKVKARMELLGVVARGRGRCPCAIRQQRAQGEEFLSLF